MCGIAGVYGRTDEAVLDAMLADMAHRGPDGEGRFVDEDRGVMLGARRLAIVDVEGGGQPMFDEDGDVVVAFNGEIYNHGSLRTELRSAGHRFRTACDTEVLVHLWEEHGPAMVERLDGMFAFSLWDREAETLLLARDRLGIKPLYYGRTADGLAWGSELPTVLEAGVDRALDQAAVYNYFRLEYPLWPRTLLESVRQVPPGGLAVVTEDGVDVRRYWRLTADGATSATTLPSAANRLRGLLEDAVERRLMADVPIGVFLSGGLDSSAIAGLLAERTDELRTFSVAFPGRPGDESEEARFVADRLGADHHEVAVDVSTIDRLDEILRRTSEPPTHFQILPTLALSGLAREHDVPVTLAGEGADELFGGYSRYRTARRARRLTGTLPGPVYDAADRLAEVTPVGRMYLRYAAGLKDDVHALLRHNCGFDLLRPRPEELLRTDLDDESAGLVDAVRAAIESSEAADPAEYMETFDLEHLLPDYVLPKTDATSMAASVEVRVPFMDRRVVSFAHRLPADLRVTPGDEKAVLKRAVADVVPKRIREREKHGMGIPVDAWFRSDHDAVAEWLAADRLATTPYVDPDRIRSLWDDHRAGRGNYGRTLWTTLAFVAWYHTVVPPDG